MTEGEMITVTGLGASIPRGTQQINGGPVLTCQIAEPGDVVVCLSYQDLHAVLRGEALCLFIGRQGPVEIVQTYTAHSDVMQRYCNRLRVFVLMLQEVPVRPLVALQCFHEAILPMKDISRVQFDA